MTKTLEERIAELEQGLTESPLDSAWEGGYETCREEALGIIKELQAETQALQKKLDEALGRVEIQEKAMKDAIYCKEYYSDPATAIKVAVKDLENALVKLNKQGVENDE